MGRLSRITIIGVVCIFLYVLNFHETMNAICSRTNISEPPVHYSNKINGLIYRRWFPSPQEIKSRFPKNSFMRKEDVIKFRYVLNTVLFLYLGQYDVVLGHLLCYPIFETSDSHAIQSYFISSVLWLGSEYRELPTNCDTKKFICCCLVICRINGFNSYGPYQWSSFMKDSISRSFRYMTKSISLFSLVEL